MSNREKLIELLCNVIETDGCSGHCDFPPCYLVKACADNLISNGVTVQKWIPVSERLPTEVDADERGFLAAYTTEGKKIIMRWEVVCGFAKFVTHWMPLPEPPKECE